MARIYKLSRTGIRLIYKIRHHRGHGIHSPFVYNLIRKVIEEKTNYYAYDDIKEYVMHDLNIRFKPNKINKLSFRLINHFDSKNILEIGSGKGLNTLYLTAPSKEIVCHSTEWDPDKYNKAQKLYSGGWKRNIVLHTDAIPFNSLLNKQDCIYINLKNDKKLSNSDLEKVSKLVYEKTFIIVEGIRTNKRCRALWKRIAETESRTVVLDLFNIGIVFFDTKLYPWKYEISF